MKSIVNVKDSLNPLTSNYKQEKNVKFVFPTSKAVQYPVQPLRDKHIMDAITYTTARQHLAHTMTRVCVDHDPIIITRNNQQSVVMMSLEDYNAMQETTYLLRHPKNAQRLLESIAQLESGLAQERELLE